VLVRYLKRVDKSKHLSNIATGRRGIGNDGANLLFRINEIHRADGEWNFVAINVGGILVVNPAEFLYVRPRDEGYTKRVDSTAYIS
jgi:hypothetical protein